jgi:hypothetical protein
MSADTKIDTPNGILNVSAVHSTRLSLHYGVHTGWYKDRDRLLYVAGHLGRRSDGTWSWHMIDGEPGVYPLKNGKADWSKALPEKIAAPILNTMRDTALSWLEAHPEFMAGVEAEEAAYAVRAAQQRVLDLQDELRRAEHTLANVLAIQAKADAKLAQCAPVDSHDHPLMAALEQAREALESAQGNINPERGYADEVEEEITAALAAARDAAGLQQALEALESAQGNINPERGYADEVEDEITAAIATVRAAIANMEPPSSDGPVFGRR